MCHGHRIRSFRDISSSTIVKEGYREGYGMVIKTREMIKTDAEIAAKKPKTGVSVCRVAIQSKHGGGLKLEVRANGLKRFVYRYKIAGKAGEMLIGGYPAMTLAKARLAHSKVVELVKQGIDPVTIAKQAKAKNIEMPTLSEIYRD